MITKSDVDLDLEGIEATAAARIEQGEPDEACSEESSEESSEEEISSDDSCSDEEESSSEGEGGEEEGGTTVGSEPECAVAADAGAVAVALGGLTVAEPPTSGGVGGREGAAKPNKGLSSSGVARSAELLQLESLSKREDGSGASLVADRLSLLDIENRRGPSGCDAVEGGSTKNESAAMEAIDPEGAVGGDRVAVVDGARKILIEEL